MRYCVLLSKEDYAKAKEKLKDSYHAEPFYSDDSGHWFPVDFANKMVDYNLFTHEQVSGLNKGWVMQPEVSYARIQDGEIGALLTTNNTSQPVDAGEYVVLNIIKAE